MRVTTLRGADAGAYYVEALPSYYLDAGEPRGVWLGRAAGMLGLSGEVADEAFLAVMAGMNPAQPDRHLGRANGAASVRGFDVTCSAPKSVSTLFALGTPSVRQHVLAAHDAAVAAMVGWIEAHAHTRYRIAGEVAVVDATGIVAAMFRQHTSRALDPQLHSHVVIPNRVKSPDGRWLALDARLIKHDQRSLSAMYHAGVRAELTARLGVGWEQPVNGIAEIADIPVEVLEEFSARTADVRRRIDVKLDRFLDTMGREPTPRERWRLEREAVVDSRPVKDHAVNAAVLHAGWAERVRTIGYDPARVVTDAIGQVQGINRIDPDEATRVVGVAIRGLQDRQSSWRPTELHREIAALVPTDTAATASSLVAWIDRTATDALERCVELSAPVPDGVMLRRDGRPVTESALDRALTTRTILIEEADVLRWAERRLTTPRGENPDAASRAPRPLNSAQTAAAGAVAGYDDLVLIVGPAGTGKTTALTPAVEQLHADGRVVFGVAPSATAAAVLAEETGVDADTIDKLLIEYRLPRPPAERFRLPVGATVIVDEAGMLATAKLADLTELADTHGWRLALVGDPLQFTAVGRGGMFGLLVDTHGAIELDRVHRFVNDWERDASLQLRRGNPDIADLYQTHGRLHDGTQVQMERAAVNHWWRARQAGSVLLMAPTNDAVDRLNQRCQQLRLRAGELDPHGPTVTTTGGQRLHVGDEIATRRNERRFTTDNGDHVRNRARWTITAVHPDQSITATGPDGRVRLPYGYVAEHVELAYATTAHGAQGRTVTTAITYLDGPTDNRNLYVPMTRGTDTNEAYITVTGEPTAVEVFARSIATDWVDVPAHTRQQELNPDTAHRPGLLDPHTLRDLLEQRHHITQTLNTARRDLDQAPDIRQDIQQQLQHAAERAATAEIRLGTARDVLDRYDRPLHRRRHAPEITKAKRDLERLPHEIHDATTDAAAATERLAHLDETVRDATAVIGRQPVLEQHIVDIDHRLVDDLHTRETIIWNEEPAHIIELLGPRPTTAVAQRDWDQTAARILQHQDAFGIDHGLGRRPVFDSPTAYADSHQTLEQHIHRHTRAIQPPQRETIDMGIEL